ncbi:MAG: hypothetical protein ABSA76_11555 [Bacteroidales bacterium]
MSTDPLKSLFELMGDDKPDFNVGYTHHYRLYSGTWEIENDRLFLIDFYGYIADDIKVSIDFLFPDQKKVFAGWFTGEIDISQGRYRDDGIAGSRVYEKYLYLKFDKGVIVGSREEVTKNFDSENLYGDMRIA